MQSCAMKKKACRSPERCLPDTDDVKGRGDKFKENSC